MRRAPDTAAHAMTDIPNSPGDFWNMRLPGLFQLRISENFRREKKAKFRPNQNET